MMFGQNGSVAMEMAMTADPRTGYGAGIVRCQGRYRYDGTTLAAEYSGCTMCDGECNPAPTDFMNANSTAPVRLQGGRAFSWGGSEYHRQP
jgi:hypothetical protein